MPYDSSSTMSSLVDPTTLSVDQLLNLLNNKKLENTQKQNDPHCSFKPTRLNQTICDEAPEIFYGNLGYCNRHRRTVQALNAKKNMEEVANNSLIQKSHDMQPKNIESEEKKKDDQIPEVLEKSGKESSEISEKKTKTIPIKETIKTVIKKKISPNKWGRFEDPDTGIIFDPKTKKAFGVQDHKTGKILPLSQKHILICKKYKWGYYYIPKDTVEKCEGCDKPNDQCICTDEEEKEEDEDDQDEEEDQGEEDEEEEEEDQVEDEEEDDDQEEEE